MNKARLHSVSLLVFAVAACGGDDGGGATAGTQPLVQIQTSTPTPSPAPTPPPATSLPTSLLPYIDVAKIPSPAAGYSTARIRPETLDVPKQNTDGSGQFRITCDYSHMAFNDPIVYPGKQGASHLHTFFGNTAIDHASTQASIERTGNSTCGGGTANRTGYWIPSVIDTRDGTPLKPTKILVYYKTGHIEGDNVQPFPAGLRMISGDMKMSAPQSVANWGCLGPNVEQRFGSIPTSCPVGFVVEATIEFPFCWDGVNLDSPDHKSHMAFSVWDNDARKTVCPKSHPVELPMIAEKIQYTVTEEGETAHWRLSSDNYSKDLPGGYSLHADWFNGWDPAVQDIWIKNCLRANRDCHGFLLGNGTTLF